MTDSSMFAALSKLRQVETVTLRVVNKIVKVERDCVWVRSERTGNDRRVSFDELRAWNHGRRNSRIRLALAVALGVAKALE